MRKCSVENKAMRWYRFTVAMLAVVLLIISGVMINRNSQTVVKEKRIDSADIHSFSFLSQEGGTDVDEVYYNDSLFRNPNDEYNHELSRASLALAMTAFKESYVIQFMKELRYEEVVSYRYDQNGDEDKAALVMGHKYTGSGPLIAVAIRGGKYGDEWGSNGRVGYDGESFGYHYGFRKAAEDAAVQLKEYASENDINLTTANLWITGFSRGAAVANVMGMLLTDDGSISSEKLFCYTFAAPSTVSESLITGHTDRGIYNVVNPLDIVTRLPMNVSGSSETSKGKNIRYNWDYTKYGKTLELPTESAAAQMQMVQLLENALAFATRNESQYVERTQDQVIVPALKKTLGKGADVSKRNIGFVLVDSLPGVATFLKNEVDQLDIKARIYVAGILSGKKSIRLEKEHWPETYWGWMVKVDELEY